ncbi:Protein MMS22-like [Desmophyllum pertusum]|uniref:Protein MMS22-like n=1 Tax=Desmophyllum pertusum TaxID=174260 RepID=A0A9W9ZPU9_9CNID|nr:Protein MMS22-like [Desmophyllum pertusum]
MEFDYSANDLQDLSEWPDSLEFDEFCDPSEAREEPLAKRQKTAVDDEPQTAGHGSVIRKPPELNCSGHLSPSRIKEALCQNGYLATGVFSAILHHENPYPEFFSDQVIQIFGAKLVTGSALQHHMETLFFMLRQHVFKLENDGSITTLTDDVHSRCVELRRKCSQFFAFLSHFTHNHLTAVQDANASNTHLRELFLLPSRLTKQLEDLSLFLGRLSSLPTSFMRTNPGSTIAPVRLTAGVHLFHLHLELNWAAIQTLCLIMEKQGQFDSLSPDRFADVINSLKKYSFSFLWDLIALAASIYNKENQSNILQVCPFPCGCVCELWIMFIHLMDHLSHQNRA